MCTQNLRKEEKEKTEAIFEEVIAENFPKLIKYVYQNTDPKSSENTKQYATTKTKI